MIISSFSLAVLLIYRYHVCQSLGKDRFLPVMTSCILVQMVTILSVRNLSVLLDVYHLEVFEKTCATSQKNVKTHVFWIFKKTLKNVAT